MSNDGTECPMLIVIRHSIVPLRVFRRDVACGGAARHDHRVRQSADARSARCITNGGFRFRASAPALLMTSTCASFGLSNPSGISRGRVPDSQARNAAGLPLADFGPLNSAARRGLRSPEVAQQHPRRQSSMPISPSAIRHRLLQSICTEFSGGDVHIRSIISGQTLRAVARS